MMETQPNPHEPPRHAVPVIAETLVQAAVTGADPFSQGVASRPQQAFLPEAPTRPPEDAEEDE